MICSNCKANCSDESLYCPKCGQSLIGSDMQITRNDFTHQLKNNRSLNFKSGEQFGERYRIIEELGKGGMGQVFKAHDNVLNIDVALKMIRPEFLMNKKMISRFKQEILLAREITHENVSRIHDFGDVDGIKFISMEFISGRTLKDIVRTDGPVDIDRAIQISRAICSGLSAAHKKDIIHRDLKPQNIMIDEDGHVFITDFGLAKSIREENVSHTGLVIGTPQYIPPELWKGEVADQRSDIYALGIIMYEMVAGEELFQSDSDYGYLQKHVNEEPEFPPPVKDKLPSFFRQLILRCLAKEREARYQDCGEIYRDLKDRMFSKGTFISEVERSIKRTGPVKIALGLLFVLVISFIGALILEKGPPKQKKRSVAILYFKNLSGMPSLDHFSYSLPELLTTDLGQSKYIKVLPEDKVSKVLKESNYLSSAFIDEKMFEELGDQANVNYLVQGSFIKSGNNLRITVKLRDSDTGELLSTDYQDATMDNIFPAVDRLTTGLKRRFNLTDQEILADIDNNIEDITTSSTKALAYYISGKKLFYENKYKESISEFQSAIDIDPEFAMAYRGIAYSYMFLNDMANRDKYFQKTISYIDNLSEKEKLLIQADYYGEDFSTFNKAIEYYNKLLKIYPDDINANLESGFFYMWFEEWDEAISRLSIALENDRSNLVALNDLTSSFLGRGQYQKAIKILTDFENIFPDKATDKILKLKFRCYIAKAKYSLALDLIKKNRQHIGETDLEYHYASAKLTMLKDVPIDTTDFYSESVRLNSGSADFSKLVDFPYIFLSSGNISKTITILDSQMRLSPKEYLPDLKLKKIVLLLSYPTKSFLSEISKLLGSLKVEKGTFFEHRYLYLKGLLELRSGNINEAKRYLIRLKEIIKDTLFRKSISRLISILQGSIERGEKEYLKSINTFITGIKATSAEWEISDIFIANNCLLFYELAYSYYLSDQLENSEKWFKKIKNLSTSKYYYYHLYARSMYYLGKIYQKKGLLQHAIKSYQRFFEMWKDGDPEFVKEFITDTEIQLQALSQKI